MSHATKEDFRNAPLGTPFLEACNVCGQDTGVILMKRKGKGKPGPYTGPMKMVTGARCEFCQALGGWLAHEKIDPRETGLKYGCAKVVRRDGKGVETVVAYIPFSSEDDTHKKLATGEDYIIRHGTVILGEDEDNKVMLTKVLKEGV